MKTYLYHPHLAPAQTVLAGESHVRFHGHHQMQFSDNPPCHVLTKSSECKGRFLTSVEGCSFCGGVFILWRGVHFVEGCSFCGGVFILWRVYREVFVKHTVPSNKGSYTPPQKVHTHTHTHTHKVHPSTKGTPLHQSYTPPHKVHPSTKCTPLHQRYTPSQTCRSVVPIILTFTCTMYTYMKSYHSIKIVPRKSTPY